MKTFQRQLLATSTSMALALAGGSAFAADLMAAPPEASPAPQFYVDLLAGGSLASTLYTYLPGTSTSDGTYPLPMGFAGALAVGYASGIQNLSFEGDFFYTDRPFVGGQVDLTTASAMG